MNDTLINISIAIVASGISGLVTAMYSAKNEKKREIVRQQEKIQDDLRIELKDAQIKLYQLEKDLNEWKEKYYQTLQQMMEVKNELEQALFTLSLIDQEYTD
jgi:peptidoglycan hydrolase CwlO-like protein